MVKAVLASSVICAMAWPCRPLTDVAKNMALSAAITIIPTSRATISSTSEKPRCSPAPSRRSKYDILLRITGPP